MLRQTALVTLVRAQSSIAVLPPSIILISSYKVCYQVDILLITHLNFNLLPLVAHGGLQGTTRPTHYYVVHNEIGFKADELQVLTNAVSYMFARATKAVSLVSPAYYADLACERGRCYLHRLLQGIGPPNPTDENVWKIAAETWRQGVNGRNLKDTMFYL